MKAMILTKQGDADVFELQQRSDPVLTAGHVIVEVKATSVNPLDVMLRSAETPWSENLPEILHGDFAGIVIEANDDGQFSVGDEVYGCAGGIAGINGALAEKMLVDESLIAKKPSSLLMKEAAALPLVSITAWEALVEKMNVQSGESLLVHGATGGVGHIAVQLGKFLGATVSTTTLANNYQQALTLGANHVIDVSNESVTDYVSKYTHGEGFDAIFDTISGEHIQNSFTAAKYNGKVATILPVSDVLQVALKGLSFSSVLMLIPMNQGIERYRHGDILRKIADLVDHGHIKPLIDETQYSIWEVAKGHQRLESKQAVGKIVLTA